MKDAPTKLSREECALSMVQRRNANTRGAQIMWSREECASNMEQRPNDAVVKDVPSKLKMEECASNMEQHGQRSYAAVKDAQT